jgi:Ras-related protein Rab-6A
MRTKYKIVFLGNQSVGKTTLISQYIYKQADEKYHPTIGIDFLSTKMEMNDREVRLQLWDTAGQERFNSIIPNYTRDSFMAVVVFDVTNKSSFEQIDHWIKDLVRINDPENKVKILVVGNKIDLLQEDGRREMGEMGRKKAEEHGGKYVQTCAMSYKDIEELVTAVNNLIREDIQLRGNIIELGSSKDVLTLEASKSRGCC